MARRTCRVLPQTPAAHQRQSDAGAIGAQGRSRSRPPALGRSANGTRTRPTGQQSPIPRRQQRAWSVASYFWRTPRSATGASRPGRRHRHSACRLAPVRWTVWFAPQCNGCNRKERRNHKSSVTTASEILVGAWSWLAGGVLCSTDVAMSDPAHISWSAWDSERKGQRREPADDSVRIATRRARWLPFAGPSGSVSLMSSRRNSLLPRVPWSPVRKRHWTGCAGWTRRVLRATG